MSYLNSSWNKSIKGSRGNRTSEEFLELEAGETLLIGDPLYISSNKFYVADNVTNHKVVAIAVANSLTGNLGIGQVSGILSLLGLSAGNVYFLGNKLMQTTSPIIGYVIRIGMAITSTEFLINIEEPILLS